MKRIFLSFYLLFPIFAFSQSKSVNRADIDIIWSAGGGHSFVPSESIGAAFDGHGQGDITRILSAENISAMNALGFGPLAYRLRTELGVEAWHWNPRGSWSEKEKQQGYWVSDSNYNGDIQISNGYRLPRRGNSHDQANDDGYSMIDDGDTNTFWKSNPYLDKQFTHEENRLHPQWVVVDLGKSYPVNAIRIRWGNPFALSYQLDYASDIGKDYFDPLQPGLWHDLSNGSVLQQQAGNGVRIFSDSILKLRFIRITMSESSGSMGNGSADIRDHLGFAIREIEVGILENGRFHDYVKHAADNEKQSVIHTSSTDPWHRAIDIDVNTEQAGIDQFFKCGLASDKPVLMPLALLYDNPENMIALLHYLKSRHYDATEFEMGEEPEGQLIDPNDYAALYCQLAGAVKRIDHQYLTGGPGFASLAITGEDQYSFTEQQWTRIFLSYLEKHQRMDDFNFFSFEWYPFDDVCQPTAPQLAANPAMMNAALDRLQEKILPPGLPIYVTEYGYSAHSGRAEVDIEGGLMYADILGKFLSMGIKKAYLYGYEPTYLDEYNNCSWGNNMLFAMGDSGGIRYHTAAYYCVKMLTQNWTRPSDSMFTCYPSRINLAGKKNQDLVSSYAIRGPANAWSVVLINKDPSRSWTIGLSILDSANGSKIALPALLKISQYSRQQYRWKAKGQDGHPLRELPPSARTLENAKEFILPPYSLTVISSF